MRTRPMFSLFTGVFAAAFASHVFAQTAPPNGLREADLRAHAIVNATVVTAPGSLLEDATIVMRDGVIVFQSLKVVFRFVQFAKYTDVAVPEFLS